MSLKQFIEQRNLSIGLFSQGAVSKFPTDVKQLTVAQKRTLAEAIANSLSPENLCCDGEAPIAHVRSQMKMLGKASTELAALGQPPLPY